MIDLAAIGDPGSLLRTIFESSPMALQLYARDGRSLVVNPAHTALFGAVPPPDYNLLEDSVLAARGLTADVQRAFAGERVSIPAIWYDIRALRGLSIDTSAGRRRAISAEMVPLRDASGEVAYVLVVFEDHTVVEQRAAQATFLAEASRLLGESLDLDRTLAQLARLATPALADFIAIDLVDDDGALRRVAAVHGDPAQQALLDEVTRRYPPSIDTQQPSPRAVRSGHAQIVSEADPATIGSHSQSDEHRDLILRLGVRSHAAVPLALGSRIVGAFTLCYVGDRRYSEGDTAFLEALASRAAAAIDHARLYRATEQARADAEAANRAKDEFLAMLGHELRNPLAPIVTALELSTSRSKELAIIERQVGHLRRLVDDLLDISRITRGTLELELEDLDLADAIADGVEAARPLIDQRGQTLITKIASDLNVRGDRARIAQVLTNLLTNAARYTEPGGRIEVHATRTGDEHTVLVRDSGAGMPAELVPRVFDIFTRGGRTVDRASGGLGLGLAIVKSLTAQHGGRVAARSAGEGRGSEFEVVLPAAEPRVVAKAVPPVASARARRGDVLVVDDNVDAAVLLAEALEQRGFTTVVAHDGMAALEAVRARAPQVAIVDIGMPGMSGYELVPALRAVPGLAALPVIALTGYGQPADRVRSARAGFSAHFVKPVSLDTILIALDLYL